MNVKNETKLYITLSILCIAIISLLNLLLPESHFKESLYRKDILERITISKGVYDPLVVLSSLFYLLFFVFGTVNLIIFILNKFHKRPLLKINELVIAFDLKTKEASQLLFSIVYLYLVFYLLVVGLITQDNLSQTYYLSIFLIFNLIINVVVIILIIKFIPLKFLGIKYKLNHFISTFRLYSSIIPLIYIITVLITSFGEKFEIYPSYHPAVYILLALKNKWLMFILILEIIILAPLCEELFFRGFIFKLARNRFGFILSSTITSLFFSLLHRSFFGFFVIFLISMAACFLYEKTQNILASFAFHSLHNSLGIIYVFIIKKLIAGQ